MKKKTQINGFISILTNTFLNKNACNNKYYIAGLNDTYSLKKKQRTIYNDVNT